MTVANLYDTMVFIQVGHILLVLLAQLPEDIFHILIIDFLLFCQKLVNLIIFLYWSF